jgi:conjugal transfer pilus assembly protein TraB
LILIVLVVIGFVVLIYLLSSSSPAIDANYEKAHFGDPLSHVDPESVVLERTQKALRNAEKKTEALQQEMSMLTGSQEAEKKASAALVEGLNKRIEGLEKEMGDSKNSQGASIEGAGPFEHMAGSHEFQGDFLRPASGPNAARNGDDDAKVEAIREDTLSLAPQDDFTARLALKNPHTYVPSGTFVKAVMIGGADASAAVNAQANPMPMLFRIVANGTLPNHKKSHLKDCVVTAAVVGDISSERGFIRLENLSCTFPNGEIVDQTVEGTVFGTEGKNGVRGTPVWRESALLQRAFAAGTLSGLSDGLSQTYTSNAISAEGNVQTVNPARIFQYGAAKGTGKAMDKLADYHIQRAEQYHPVIQLSAGTVVDIVFLKGFFLDGKKHEGPRPAVDQRMEQDAPPTLFSGNGHVVSGYESTLPLSPDEVKRIQEKSKAQGLTVTIPGEEEGETA